MVDGFDHRDAVLAAATHVVDLPGAGTSGELFDGPDYVVAVDVVANLLALVTEDCVVPAYEGLLDEIGEETVKFDPGVGRSGEATTAENADVHFEVATIFLGDEIGSGFGGAKEGVERAINAAGFVNTIEVFRAGIVPARGKFGEGNFIGGVSIDFIGAEEDEDGSGRVQARGFQKVDGAECVDFKIENGNIAGLVVRRLRGTVDDKVEAMRTEELLDGCAIADVQADVNEVAGFGLESFEVPEGVAGGAEEFAAHVVVDADDVVTLAVKMFDGFRTDETAGASDKNLHEIHLIYRCLHRATRDEPTQQSSHE